MRSGDLPARVRKPARSRARGQGRHGRLTPGSSAAARKGSTGMAASRCAARRSLEAIGIKGPRRGVLEQRSSRVMPAPRSYSAPRFSEAQNPARVAPSTSRSTVTCAGSNVTLGLLVPEAHVRPTHPLEPLQASLGHPASQRVAPSPLSNVEDNAGEHASDTGGDEEPPVLHRHRHENPAPPPRGRSRPAAGGSTRRTRPRPPTPRPAPIVSSFMVSAPAGSSSGTRPAPRTRRARRAGPHPAGRSRPRGRSRPTR